MSVLQPVLQSVLQPALSLSLTRAGVPSAFAELNLLAPTLDPRITFTRASTKTYIGADGLLHTAAVNECPLEYDPVTLLPVGRSFWEARTNLLLNSGAPATQSITTTAQSYTLSFTGTGTVTLSGAFAGSKTGTGTGPANRVSLTFTATAGTLTVTPSGGVQNFQIEAAAAPGPYIPTTASQVTRAADVATVNDLSTLRFNPAEGTLFVEYQVLRQLDTVGNVSVASINDTTTANRMQIRTYANRVLGTFVDAGMDYSRVITGTYATGQTMKSAITFSSAGANMAVNGVTSGLGTGGLAALSASVLQMCGGTGDSTGLRESACLRRVCIYPSALSASQLQALTA